MHQPLPYVQCPYCRNISKINYPIVGGTPPVEIEALPYARDIGRFDPDEGQHQSLWTVIGKDLFVIGGWSYESIGILRMENGWHIQYCVVRCPKCEALMDVFANFTKGKTLSEIWPHLLGRVNKDNPNYTRLWAPDSILSDNFLMTLFLGLVFIGSIAPYVALYAKNFAFHTNVFLAQVWSTALMRGIVTISLIILLSRRSRMIDMLRNKSALSRVFMIAEKEKGLIYWSNFAMCRIVGYTNINPVFLLGGVFSSLILFITWVLVRLSFFSSTSQENFYIICAELTFWLITSFLFGVVVWNFSQSLPYIFRGIKRIPVNVHGPYIKGFKFIEQTRRYYLRSLYLLVLFVILLSMVPVFSPLFEEEIWTIIWAQFVLLALIWFSSRRFIVESEPMNFLKKAISTTKLLSIVVIYLLLRYGIGISQTNGPLTQIVHSLDIIDTTFVQRYSELVLFSFLAVYLYYILENATTLRDIQERVREKHMDFLYQQLDKAQASQNFKNFEIIQKSIEPIYTNLRTNAFMLMLPVITALISATIPLVATRLFAAIWGKGGNG